MLDIDFITENPDVVRRAIEVKHVDLDLDELLHAHGEMKSVLQQVEALRAERNRLSKLTGSAPKDERQQYIEQSRQLGEQLKDVEPRLRELELQLRDLILRVP